MSQTTACNKTSSIVPSIQSTGQFKALKNKEFTYMTDDIIGEVPFGISYRGQKTSTKTPITVKVIRLSEIKHKDYGSKLKKAIRDEVNSYQTIANSNFVCPHITKYYDHFETSNNMYLITDYSNEGIFLSLFKIF